MSAFATRQKVDASALNRTSELYNKILPVARNALIVAMDEAGEAQDVIAERIGIRQARIAHLLSEYKKTHSAKTYIAPESDQHRPLPHSMQEAEIGGIGRPLGRAGAVSRNTCLHPALVSWRTCASTL
jgi:hypothetical protein